LNLDKVAKIKLTKLQVSESLNNLFNYKYLLIFVVDKIFLKRFS